MRRFPLVVSCFEKVVLSYEVGNMKPDPEIFAAAATAAATQPSEIFYIDDLQKNVDGANASGFDAVCYSSTSSLVTEMSRRGIQISY
ncbi:MAG: HAD-IA family hydrolase, partial [Planctomycetales bacterium]